MSSKTADHDDYLHHILQAIADDAPVSQRLIARDLGIALGLANLLVRGLVSRGLIRVSRIHPARVRYLLTPAGVAEKARMSRDALVRAVDRYATARRRLGESLKEVSLQWPSCDGGRKAIAFWGTGEMAEIGYVCLQETDLTLVGAVDDQNRGRFFGVPVVAEADARRATLEQWRADAIVIMSVRERSRVQVALQRSGVSGCRILWP